MTNVALDRALREYDRVRETYLSQLRAKGVKFAEPGSSDARCAELREELARRGATFRNAGASIVTGWLSPACVECTGNQGSETFSTTLRCHRDCYFCFNHNLSNYQDFFENGCPWEEELEAMYQRSGGKLAALAVTGGEPLLSLEGTLSLLKRAGELFPHAHKRMYTSGDLLTPESAARLRDAGLQEIRFSVKQDDPADRQELVLANMAMATEYFDDVMVEMPIIPGTKERMKELLHRFAQAGIHGMNLLEFCFPCHNWEEFDRRGFVVRNPPYPVMYDYSYSGALPIAGSEELCLELMLYGLDQELPFGMHYCSLENKHRSEMRQMNECAASAHPAFQFDEGDFFLKTAKVFGPDVPAARSALADAGCQTMLEDPEEQSLAFPPRFLPVLRGLGVQPVSCFCVLETDQDGGGRYITEVGMELV